MKKIFVLSLIFLLVFNFSFAFDRNQNIKIKGPRFAPPTKEFVIYIRYYNDIKKKIEEKEAKKITFLEYLINLF